MSNRFVIAGMALATLVAAVPAVAQNGPEDQRFAAAQARFDREYQLYRQAVDRYQQYRAAAYPAPGYDGYAPPPPAPVPAPPPAGYYDTDRVEDGYDPARYYRPGPETVLGADDRVYAGQDGRYYCRRSDGTTGLIVGAAAGGLFGNIIAGGHSKTVGTLLGAGAGALAGRAIDQNSSEVRCR